MSLIEIRDLKKEYDNAVPLRGINADIEEGEVISIIGPSGTGKSTLLRCINRLETPTSGTVTVDGVNVCDPSADLPKVRRSMGMVFQSFNLFPHKMVVENIMVPQQSLLGKSPQEAYAEAMDQLARVGLADKARQYPDELSGGQKQRVAIARALAMHPKILLFDEPTSALDPTMVSEVLSAIRDLAGTGLTMLIVTHEMRLARNVSDRVFFMNEGEIYEEGTPEEIFDHPRREATRNFIFRIRNWDYRLSVTEQDFHGMMGSLEKFCKDQFLGRHQATNCQLAVEELATSFLLVVQLVESISNKRFVLTLRFPLGLECSFLLCVSHCRFHSGCSSCKFLLRCLLSGRGRLVGGRVLEPHADSAFIELTNLEVDLVGFGKLAVVRVERGSHVEFTHC